MITNLTIDTIFKNGRTLLANAYATPPLKIANITEDKNGGYLHLMLMSSSPGVLEGDEYNMTITAAENCRLILTTQSYQRLFSMQKGASQLLNVHVKNGACFCFMPHPLVPHRASVFTSTNNIFLGEKSSLIWGEIITCGRKLNGESFAFGKLHVCTNVYMNNRVAIKENVFIVPANTNFLGMGLGEGYSHQASLLCINNHLKFNEIYPELNDLLHTEAGIIYGLTSPAINGVIIRILGNRAEQLFGCLQKITTHLQTIINRQTPVYAG